jgi:mono/diheme cytochrome c family protein
MEKHYMIAMVRVGLLMACIVTAACSESQTPQSSLPAAQPAPQYSPPAAPNANPAPKDTAASSDSDAASEAQGDLTTLVKRGRATYTANCIACHNPDPSQDGGIGPSVAGSSVELLEARIMRNEYPQGYQPKRDTKAMIPLPYLEKDIPALAAFLAQ